MLLFGLCIFSVNGNVAEKIKLLIFVIRRYITTDELEQALRDFGMHDGRDIKEIISEVDADNVSVENDCFYVL